jgi:hypothetical protein
MTQDQVEDILGKPELTEVAPKGGSVQLGYQSLGVFITVGKTRGVVIITCTSRAVTLGRLNDFSGRTDKGIALGASSADIVRAYGAPDSKRTEQGTTFFSYARLELNFTLADDRLVQIFFSRQRP